MPATGNEHQSALRALKAEIQSAKRVSVMISWLKENNVAVITGGANGIGRSAVDAFLARGCTLLLLIETIRR